MSVLLCTLGTARQNELMNEKRTMMMKRLFRRNVRNAIKIIEKNLFLFDLCSIRDSSRSPIKDSFPNRLLICCGE